jgi:membrane-bound metal-dependent hydrolase YbcI (DUF457 family)
LGAKRYAPQVSLGIFFLACQLADLIWPVLVLVGVETFNIVPGITALTPLEFTHYPYSHSLLMLLIWSLLLGGIYVLLFRGGTKVALAIALVVLSHWVLDVATHRPDMPLSPGESTLLGLGLWNYPLWAILIELALFGAGIWLYLKSTRSLDKTGTFGFWAWWHFCFWSTQPNFLGRRHLRSKQSPGLQWPFG